MLKETGMLIREALNLEIMKNCRMIAGFSGIDNAINRVNIMADPDILNWVSEGEFLLTTAYYFKITSVEEQVKLIREASQKKLSGIGIKIYPYLEKLEDEVIATANELNFPIVELDHAVPFADLMTPIFKEVFNKQSLMLQKIESVHNDTMDVVLKGGGIREIIRVLMRTVENPVLVKDHHFEEFFYDESILDADYEGFVKTLRKTFKSATQSNRYIKKVEDRILVNNDYVDRVMVPILIRNTVYGHLVVFGTQRKVSSFDVQTLESASTIIALDFLKRISVQEVENKYKAEFFDDLVSLDERRKSKAIERAYYYRFQKDAPYSVVSIHLSEVQEAGFSTDELNQTINRIIYLIDSGCRSEERTFLIANKGAHISILFMWDDNHSYEKEIRGVSETIDRLLEQKIGVVDYRIGIGRQYSGIEAAWRSLQDAEKAVESARSYFNERIIEFERLGIYKIFCQDHLKDELRSFYDSTLKDLVEYDRRRDTELVKSLQVYFETNGNLKKMSEILFTHYNTILYRINRIQEITGKSLETEHDRYGLQTALKIMMILDL